MPVSRNSPYDKVYWENPDYKNPIVGNPEKAERKDWVFHDTPLQRLIRILGFGSDWMTQLPIEERIQFWDWPWQDWWMYDLMPMPHNQREYDIPNSYITSPQFKVRPILFLKSKSERVGSGIQGR